MNRSLGDPDGNPLDSLLRQLAELPLDAQLAVERADSSSVAHVDPIVAADTLFGFRDFRLVRELGRGAMGVVYEAHQLSLDRRVALKVLQGHLQGDPKRRARFLFEATAASRSAHVNIVQVYEIGEEQGHHFIVQELVPGGTTLADTLRELRDARELPADYYLGVAQRFAKLADALDVAHSQGVLHRDIKPTNILLCTSGEPKIADFGVAKALNEIGATETGESPGTPSYRSPEQVDARFGRPGPRSDLFSLGATLYESLTLTRLFTGDTDLEIARKITEVEAEDPRRIRGRVPQELALICLKALEKQPIRRYASAVDLAADLRRYLRQEPIHARPATRIDRLLKWVRRNPAKSATAAVAAAAFAVVTLLLFANLRTNRALGAANTSLIRLAAMQDLEDLVAKADELWPAHPEQIRAYEDWIVRARRLVDDLPLHRAKRDELRMQALPTSEADRTAARESHPDRPRLLRLQRELRAKQAALLQRRDGVGVELPAPDWSRITTNSKNLVHWAWPFVDPQRKDFGDEGLGLVVAQRAIENASSADEFMDSYNLLAWANLALGRDDAAIRASEAALAAATDRRRVEFEGQLARLQEAATQATSEAGLRAAIEEGSGLEREKMRLESMIEERRIWTFPEAIPEARWWHEQLVKLIDGLDELERGLLSVDAASEAHGWSVRKRVEFARSIAKSFGREGEHRQCWEAALPEIRKTYAGLEIAPQLGLVPIGPDPLSGLWEFGHLQTGELARRGDDGKLVVDESTGLVFVLLPGGQIQMGAQSTDPSGMNFDPLIGGDAGPVHAVVLSPYFLSKYEMTQGQWLRFTGRNPSLYGPDSNIAGHRHNLLHPVEQVSWTECVEVMKRLGLSLPSEAQWENGCRGGTDTPWWTGVDRESLRGRVNLADQTAARGRATWQDIEDWPDLEDGWVLHAAVGSFPANGYGLHEVHGNVWEWCADGYHGGFYGRVVGADPVATTEGAGSVVLRGGSFNDAASGARSAFRNGDAREFRFNNLGLRPAKAAAVVATPLTADADKR